MKMTNEDSDNQDEDGEDMHEIENEEQRSLKEWAQTVTEQANNDFTEEKRLYRFEDDSEGIKFLPHYSLYDSPAIQYLRETEEVVFILHNDGKGVGIRNKNDAEKPSSRGGTLIFITDQRVLVLLGRKDGDVMIDVLFNSINGTEYSTGLSKHRLSISTTEEIYHIWINLKYSKNEIHDLFEYINDKADVTKDTGLIDDDLTDNPKSEHEEITYLKTKQKENQEDDMDENQEDDITHFSYNPFRVSVKGNDDYKGLGKYIKFKDSGIYIQTTDGLSKDVMRITYNSIENFEINTTIFSKIVIHTHGNTYKASKCMIKDKDKEFQDVEQELFDFVDKKRQEARQLPQHQSSDTESDNQKLESKSDPLERLKLLKELQDEGIINDEEFLEKKESILDEV